MDSILIDDDGVHFVYSDTLASVFDGEEQVTKRASHVEPAPFGGWMADMRPSGGPVLFASATLLIAEKSAADFDWIAAYTGAKRKPQGFKTRTEALDAEREWLRKERGL